MVRIRNVSETIHYDKNLKSGWDHKKIKYMITFKTKKPFEHLVKYEGFYMEDCDSWYIGIHKEYTTFPIWHDKIYNKRGMIKKCQIKN